MDFKIHVEINKAMDGMLKERLVDIPIFLVIINGGVLVLLWVLGYLEYLLRCIL